MYKKKKTFCFNDLLLNERTAPDDFFLPDIANFLAVLKFFSSVNLYLIQIVITQDCQHKLIKLDCRYQRRSGVADAGWMKRWYKEMGKLVKKLKQRILEIQPGEESEYSAGKNCGRGGC